VNNHEVRSIGLVKNLFNFQMLNKTVKIEPGLKIHSATAITTRPWVPETKLAPEDITQSFPLKKDPENQHSLSGTWQLDVWLPGHSSCQSNDDCVEHNLIPDIINLLPFKFVA